MSVLFSLLMVCDRRKKCEDAFWAICILYTRGEFSLKRSGNTDVKDYYGWRSSDKKIQVRIMIQTEMVYQRTVDNIGRYYFSELQEVSIFHEYRKICRCQMT